MEGCVMSHIFWTVFTKNRFTFIYLLKFQTDKFKMYVMTVVVLFLLVNWDLSQKIVFDN